ncbi:MAG: hypothetical protein KY469_12575 [Actinobacteria bacterium]|nr:hypothetical protein [Actinomycetota bacterium]
MARTKLTVPIGLMVISLATVGADAPVPDEPPPSWSAPVTSQLVPGRVLPVDVVQLDEQRPTVATPSPRLEQVLTQVADPRDPVTYPDAVRVLLEDAWGVALLDVRAEPTPSDTADTEEEAEPSGVLARAYRGGDLDGDDLEDVLVVAFDPQTEAAEVRALRGTDGAELWRLHRDETVVDEFVWPVGDLDGDRIGDLYDLVFRIDSYDYTDECDASGCTFEAQATFTWDLVARNGRDGSLLWHRHYPGSYFERYHYQDTTFGSTEQWDVEITDLATLPLPGDDHDGDGGPDVLVNEIDLTVHYRDTRDDEPVGARDGEFQLRSRTDAAVLRGADATVLSTLVNEGPSIATLRTAGNAVGDDTLDLLWERTTAEDDIWSCIVGPFVEYCADEEEVAVTYELELYDGSDLATSAWTMQPQDVSYPIAVPLRHDVDGDGYDDVLLDDLTFDDGYRSLWSAISGRTGTVTWQTEGPFAGLHTVAEMGGTAGNDLLLTAMHYRFHSGCVDPLGLVCPEEGRLEVSFVLYRLDGSTGEQLDDTSRRFTLPYHNYLWFTFPAYGDHDGDAVVDPSFATGTVGAPGGDRSVGLVQSARTGEDLYVIDEDGFALAGSLGADLDGNATTELLRIDAPTVFDPGEATALAMPEAQAVWTVPDEQLWELAAGGDQDGQPGDELTRAWSALDDTGVHRSFVDSLVGATLVPRWTREVAAPRP